MFAFVAVLCFFVGLFQPTLGPINLVTCGLLALALHFLVGGIISWPWKR